MIPITRETAQVLLSRVDLSILEKSDLEYVRYFIKLMEGFMTFSLQKGCSNFDLPFDKGIAHHHLLIHSQGSSAMMTICQFIYFLQIEIYEILPKLNGTLPAEGHKGDKHHHGFTCHCDLARRSIPSPWNLKPSYGGGSTLISNVFGLMGEFRYKFNSIDDITKFISAMELYLLNQAA